MLLEELDQCRERATLWMIICMKFVSTAATDTMILFSCIDEVKVDGEMPVSHR